MPRVLIIEDDTKIRRSLDEGLRAARAQWRGPAISSCAQTRYFDNLKISGK